MSQEVAVLTAGLLESHALSPADELDLQALEAELGCIFGGHERLGQFQELELPSAVHARLVAFAESMPAPLEAELSEVDDAELEAELAAIFAKSAEDIDSTRLQRLADAAEAVAEQDLHDLFERTSTPLVGADRTRVAAKSMDAPGRARQAADRAWFSRSVLVASAAAAALALYMGFGGGAADTIPSLTPSAQQAAISTPGKVAPSALANAKPAIDTDTQDEADMPDEESLMLSAMGFDDDSTWSLDPLETPDDDEDLDAVLAALDDVAHGGW